MVTPGVRGASPRRLRWIAVGQIVLWGAIGLGAFLLLAKSVQNSPQFGRLQLWILLFDICAVIALSVLLARKLWRLVRDYRAHEPPQLAREQHAERDHAADVEQQDPQLQTAELGRVLHALGEQQEGAEPDGGPQHPLPDRDPAQPARRGVAQTGSDHVYHSLTRAQSSVQKRIARSDAGKCPRRTPARTLMV